MARGYPDYANPVYTIASRNLDFNVINTMIGGIATLDGRGRLFWYDNFREGLGGWLPTYGGDGNLPVVSTAWSEVQPASLLLSSGSAGSSYTSQAVKQFVMPRNLPIGLECSFLNDHGTGDIAIELAYYFPTTGYVAGVKFESATKKVYLRTTGGYTELTEVGSYDPRFNIALVKFTADWINNKYGRLIIGDTEYDISAYPLNTVGFADRVHVEINLYLHGDVSDSEKFYFGHVYFTTDEP
jgi:hypothetical protein